MEKTKVIAFYLPQFYRVKENDEWWGEGFTDWVSAKNASSYYEGHYQPHIPLNDYYYELTNKETMIWQSKLMKQYQVDGLCFYHYWFENGRMILEKPAENLLSWTDIDMPFCFSWANETWARSWSKIRDKNVWSDILEKSSNKEEKSILLKQSYGDEEEWRSHFDYLLPFFRDDRYIKINGKPLFLIYRSDIIDCMQEMMECWRKWSQESGFPGLYVIGSYGNVITERTCLDAELLCEPANACRYIFRGVYDNELRRASYTELWNAILSRNEERDNVYYGGFVSYDDTPRRGLNGLVVDNVSPQLFGRYLAELMAKNVAKGNELIFINAWNEWGEGMHLEPDKRYGMKFLEQIKKAKENYTKYLSYYCYCGNRIKAMEGDKEKYELYLNDLDRWMGLREKNVSLIQWFLDREFENIAIYGYGIMARHLINELSQSKVVVKYLIDKQKNKLNVEIPVYTPVEKLPDVDIIVVASYYYFSDIKEIINDELPIISLRDVIYNIDNGY